MSVDDAKKIYDGPDDAATRYFQGKMTKPLAALVDRILSPASAAEADAAMRFERS